MHGKRQAIAFGIDLIDDGIDLIGFKGRKMQHRAEDLLIHLLDTGHFEHRGRDKVPTIRTIRAIRTIRTIRASHTSRDMQRIAQLAHLSKALDVTSDLVLRRPISANFGSAIKSAILTALLTPSCHPDGGVSMDKLLDGRLADMASAIREGQIKSTDLVRAFLDRIEKVNPELNAVVFSMAEHALKMAARADTAIKNQEATGPLHGVPITIKDSLDTFDGITTWGTQGRQSFRPGRDATCVARLREAGAIILGKTNTPEFTLSFQTDNLVYGRTNNPFDPARTPGGSSGGAAAIIAAGASPLDIGTDTGGSIRLPAHFCGIKGLKPTTGRVPCTGNALPTTGLLAPLSQPGPMARHVDDLSLVLELISGPDFIDPHVVPAPLRAAGKVDVPALRVAFHSDNGIATPTPAISNTILTVVELLRDAGMAVTEARPSGIEMTGLIMSRVFGADNGEMVDALLEDSRTTTPSPPIQESLEHRGSGMEAREFAQVINIWHNYQSSMLGFFKDFDVLICPVNARTALPHTEREKIEAYTYTSAFNLTGWPGLVLRAGTDDDGMPIGVQIVAAPFREDHCLGLAKHLEAALGEFPLPRISATTPD